MPRSGGRPPAEQIAPEFREASSELPAEKADVKRGKGQQAGESAFGRSETRHSLGSAGKNFLEPVRVKAGLSDGMMTEVQGDRLKEGMEVVLGQQAQATGPAGTANPFIPQFGRGRGGGR